MIYRHTLWACAILLAATQCQAASVAEDCRRDLDALPAFLLENDTGAKDELAQWGQAHFDAAMAKARQDAETAQDADACKKVLNAYLKNWRRGHLNVTDVPQAKPAAATPVTQQSAAPAAKSALPKTPSLQIASAKTLVLTIPSFGGPYREPLIALLKQHRKALLSHPYWIIDVRGNGGGDDESFYPLLPWITTGEWATAGAAWLVTPTNIEGQGRVCEIFSPGDPVCKAFMDKAIARMKGAAPGTYVQQQDGPPIIFDRAEKLEPRRPSRVVILTDRGCGSTCEEFLLAARQSLSVKLVGRSSYGTLDYSNLRPYDLPSGARRLFYATSRSNRLPDFQVDVAGVQPDIYLPLPADDAGKKEELVKVQRWIEGGSLK